MLREITSVEEMAALPNGAHILNRFRPPLFVREKYGRPDDDWSETTFRLKQDFTDDDRYFAEVKE